MNQETQQSFQSTTYVSEIPLQQEFYDNISTWGIWPTVIAIIIISTWLILEMGTFFGFMIPADLLLYTSWLILWANQRRWSAIIMLICAIVATVVWDILWYYSSYKIGASFYTKPDTRYFKKKHLYYAQAALEKYWDKIFYIGKFLHIRSFLPILAGIGRMNIVQFWLNSLLSTTIWVSATFIPSFLIGALFPQLIDTRWMIVVWFLVFIGTELIAWAFLFNQEIKQIAQRLRESQQQFASIKEHMIHIKDNISEVAEYVVKGDNDMQIKE